MRIASFPDYDISESGVVTSYKYRVPRVLKWFVNPVTGYPQVNLCDGKVHRFAVHLLVLETFVGPRPPDMVARHLDGNRLNASLSNLEWATQSENLRDMRQHGTDFHLNKTHCPQGHAYDAQNTYIQPDGRRRRCRTCRRAVVQRYRARKQASTSTGSHLQG